MEAFLIPSLQGSPDGQGKERAQLSREHPNSLFMVVYFAEVTKLTLPPPEHPEPLAQPDPNATGCHPAAPLSCKGWFWLESALL